MNRVTTIFLVLLGLGRGPDALASWSFGPVHLGNVSVNGTYAGRIPLEANADGGSQIVPYLTHQLTIKGGRATSTMVVEGLKTFLSIRENRQAIWRSPCGVEVRQRIGEFDRVPSDALARIYYADGGNGLVTTRDGWRFMYLQGALVRMISPDQIIYRCRTRGPLIEDIWQLVGGRPVYRLRAQFADDGRVNSVAVNGNDYTFVYSDTASISQVYRQGRAWLHFGYENALLARIGGDPRHEGELLWERAPASRMLVQMVNPSGLLLKAYRNETYHFSMSQSTIRLARVVGGRRDVLRYNLYTEAVTYE